MFANEANGSAPVCPVCGLTCRPKPWPPGEECAPFMDTQDRLWIVHVTCSVIFNRSN